VRRITNTIMILDQHFDRIVVISLPDAGERAERALRELREKLLSSTAVVFKAIDGKLCPPSDWWPSGPGAWGCMQSHYAAVQSALMDGVERLLVIEDDCIWQNEAAPLVADFMSQVPADWGQIYFGGQHRNSRRPEWLSGKPAVLKARSVHRTHAYAISRAAMSKFLQHVVYAPDYIEAARDSKRPHKRHVDHQLEVAHQRGDWPVYCPSFWLAGQGENHSSINGREWPAAWWHLSWRENHRRLPVVICDRAPTAEEMKWLHFGRHLLQEDQTIDVGVRDSSDAADLVGIFEKVASEALGCQRLPALNGQWPEKTSWLQKKWPVPVLLLSENPDLAALCDFPASKLFRHDWLNPAKPRLAEAVEPTESTEATRTGEHVPCVHQVWIGDAELPPRLAAYCETVRAAFPGWEYKLWREEDMQALAQGAVMSDVVAGRGDFNIGLRADIVRLEILRQCGGVYLDTDFEALRRDLRPLFERKGFTYSDYFEGGPSNSVMAASEPGDPVVELYLRRIRGHADLSARGTKAVLHATGPARFAEVLSFHVGSWEEPTSFFAGDELIGNSYAGGEVHALLVPVCFPYWFTEATWSNFEPANYPQAWAAHHWENSWNVAGIP
jgi:hypothetical protein